MRGRKVDLKQAILRRMMEDQATAVWTPNDFLSLGSRPGVDQALKRLLEAKTLRRLARGLYELAPTEDALNARPAPDLVKVVETLERREKVRMVLAEQGKSTAVVTTVARLRPLKVGGVTIEFRTARKKSVRAVPAAAPVRLTGDVGHQFEDFIAARLLLDMLSGTNSLGVEFGRITRLDWQAKDAGWHVDDLAVSCGGTRGEDRAIGLSIKSYPQVTTSGFPNDFVRLAWAQWDGRETSRLFRRGRDAIVLVTPELTTAIARGWHALLNEILANKEAPERIASRLSEGKGQSSAVQRAIYRSFARPDAGTTDSGAEETVQIIHDVRLLDFDFQVPNSRDAGRALVDCQRILRSGASSDAGDLWERLIAISARKRPLGGSIVSKDVLNELRGKFTFHDHPDFRTDWEMIDIRAAESLAAIGSLIGGVVQLPRLPLRTSIVNLLSSTGICFLVGESGCGKSSLAKDIATSDYSRTILLTGVDLDHETLIDVQHALQLSHSLIDVLCAASERCCVIFDGLENYSERALKNAAAIASQLSNTSTKHVNFVLSSQFAFAEKVLRRLATYDSLFSTLELTPVPRPSEDDVREVLLKIPSLRWLAARPEVRSILTNLKILDLLARSQVQDSTVGFTGVTGLIDRLWEDWTESGDEGLARSHLLMGLASAEGDTLARGVPRNQISGGYAEQKALPSLVKADLVRLRDEKVSFAHDLLGDWARLRVLVAEDPISSSGTRARVLSPRWQQSFRLYGQRLLERSEADQKTWQTFVESAGEDPATPDALLRDLFLDALFLATNSAQLMEKVWGILVAHEGRLLRKLLHRFLLVATAPNPLQSALVENPDDASRFEHLFRVPFGPYWGPLLTVLRAHKSDVVRLARHLVARVCVQWLQSVPTELADGRPFPWREEAADLALAIARETHALSIEHSYYVGSEDRIAFEALLYASRDRGDEGVALALEIAGRKALAPEIVARREAALEKRKEEHKANQRSRPKLGPSLLSPFRRRRNAWPDGPQRRIERAFREACLDTAGFAQLIQASADAALEILLSACIEEPGTEEPSGDRMPECGLSYWPEGEPPAFFRGPFLPFLRLAPTQALSFIVRLTNFATHRYTRDRAWVDISSESGTPRRWYGDANVFRWHFDWPIHNGSQVQSGLMALEQWLYEQIDQGSDIEPWVSRIVAESESLALAGVLFTVAKKAPNLVTSALKPLFFAWQMWDWDFQLTLLRQTDHDMMGYWGHQSPLLVKAARRWYDLPHRSEYLLGPDGALPKEMLRKTEYHPFLAKVRQEWKKSLGNEYADEHLKLLIERIDPANYRFTEDATGACQVDFQWPEAIAKENDESLRRLRERQQFTQLPLQCRRYLDSKKIMSSEEAAGLWDFLQAVDANPPDFSSDKEVPVGREDVLCGGIAVLLSAASAWLEADKSRMEWCRARLTPIAITPPAIGKYESELSVANWHWHAFAATCGVALLIGDQNDTLGRRLVANAVTGFNYGTVAVAMASAAAARKNLPHVFHQMNVLAIEWAALRPILNRCSRGQFVKEHDAIEARKKSLIDQFVARSLPDRRPDVKTTNDTARAALDDLYEREFPEAKERRAKRVAETGTPKSREKIHAGLLGLDSRVMKASFGWIDFGSMEAAERADWLKFIRECLAVVLHSLPTAPNEEVELDGLPSDFDDWVFQLIATAIPRMTVAENGEELWRAILDLGPFAHDWVERFFWYWFTDGLRASPSVSEFGRIWQTMIEYALQSTAWNPPKYSRHDLEAIVIELLCFDQRWNAVVQQEPNAPAIAKLENSFEKAMKFWGHMPRVVNGFSTFVVLPGARALLVPGLRWIAEAVRNFDSYDWKYGLDENVIEFLRVFWLRENQRLVKDAALRATFLNLLGVLASRGLHSALALRERVAAAFDS